MKKQVLILCLAICVLFTLSSACAEDVNKTVVASDNTDQVIEEVDGDAVSEVNKEIISSSENEDSVSVPDDGTFTALQKKINDAEEGSTITLENDYTYNEGFSTKGITISKSITIDGKGHTLNGLSKSRIFFMTNKDFDDQYVLNQHSDIEYTVVLNNINLINGNPPSYGGGIYLDTYWGYSSSSKQIIYTFKLNINNCTFINNSESAIFSTSTVYSGNTVYIYDSKFENNRGSAIRNGVTVVVDSIDYYAGKGLTNVVNSVFTNNTASYGGAIFSNLANITNCNFNENCASKNGGAIYAMEGIANKCTFINNQPEGKDAIGITTVNCVFKSSSSDSSSSTSKTTTTTKKLTPKLTASAKTFKVKTKIKKYVVTLKTNKNKVMKNIKLTLKVKGKTYTAKTNSKGKAIFKIKNLKKKGTYKATVTFKGDKNYNKVSKTVKIKVK